MIKGWFGKGVESNEKGVASLVEEDYWGAEAKGTDG